MEKRAIFPALMFLMAGLSFTYGTWQFFHARQVQTASDARLAHVVTTIEESGVSRAQKQQLYTTIADGLPKAPSMFGLDFSGSFASQQTDDHCTNDGQRALCRALAAQGTDAATVTAVCGVCAPQ